MKRLNDFFQHACVLAPVSVAASTATTTAFVDSKGRAEVAFLLSLAALAKGKSVTVGIYTSDAAAGTGAVKVAEQKFTAADALTKPVFCASYKPASLHGRYVGVKFQHDGADAILCSATASSKEQFCPAVNAFVLEV